MYYCQCTINPLLQHNKKVTYGKLCKYVVNHTFAIEKFFTWVNNIINTPTLFY